MRKVKKSKSSKSKAHLKAKNVKFASYDEEISEDDLTIDSTNINSNNNNNINNINNLKNNINIVNNVKKSKKEDFGELWHYIYDNQSDTEDNPDLIDSQDSTDAANINSIEENINSIESINSIENINSKENINSIEDKMEDTYDRLEDSIEISGNLLDFDQFEELSASYDWITKSNESKDQYKALVKKFKQIDKEVPAVLTSESQSRLKRIERKAQYESTKRFLTKKWAPIVKAIRKSETLVYGSDPRSEPTVSTICTKFTPETELEKELNGVGNEVETKLDNTALVRAIIAREQKKNKRINRIKSKRWHKRQKQRDLQMAAKLLGKIDDPELATEIKNTFERKRAEKRILRKKEAQTKWAKMALRYGGKDLIPVVTAQQNDLKNTQDLIEQTVRLGDEEDEDSVDGVDDSVDSVEGVEDVNSKLNVILDSTVPIPSKGLFNLTFMKNAIQNQREQLNNNDNDEGDSDGDSVGDVEDSDGDEHLEEKSDDELDYNILVNNEGVEVDEQIIKLNKFKNNNNNNYKVNDNDKVKDKVDDKDDDKVKELEMCSEEEMCREEVRISCRDQSGLLNFDQDKTSELIRSVGYTRADFNSFNPSNLSYDSVNTKVSSGDTSRPNSTKKVDKTIKTKESSDDTRRPNSTKKVDDTVKTKESSDDTVNDKESVETSRPNSTKKIDDTVKTSELVDKTVHKDKSNKENLVNNTKELNKEKCVERLGKDNELDNLMDELEVYENEENKEFVKQMFITRPDEDYLEDEEEEEEKKVTNMAGWGSWTGHGIINTNSNNDQMDDNMDVSKDLSKVKKDDKMVDNKVKKRKIQINSKKDPKLAKYYIHKLEHPYTSRQEYNTNMEIPIGPEWNTINMHQKLIKPKKMIRIGSVIMPLGLGNKHKQLLNSFRKNIIKNRTHARL